MKILLVYPDSDPLSVIPHKLINIEPLGLEYIAGALGDHEVTILDMKNENRWEQALVKFGPDIVGVSGTVIHTNRMIEVLRKAKELNPGTLTVAGGTHATLMPTDFDNPA
ncbi:MAG: cobalamin B12-binding domain-containing protein, partial [Candidatus Zixiibacteriota bacterium]